MKKQQWITAGASFLLVIILFALTQNQLFGIPPHSTVVKQKNPETLTSSFSIDSLINSYKSSLPEQQTNRLNFLEHSISRGDVHDQQLHIYHQLAQFWKDTAKKFEAYAWYLAQGARLENSEKSLTFAARLFLDNLSNEEKPELKQWEALEAKDLFERSLKLNPQNDSSKVGLGATLLYGGIAMPMEGIGLIREVADKDPSNIYAQMTLGQASMVSGQLDKAVGRFEAVLQKQPNNLEALLLLAEVYEQTGKKTEAIENYKKSLPLLNNPALKKEVETRIKELNK